MLGRTPPAMAPPRVFPVLLSSCSMSGSLRTRTSCSSATPPRKTRLARTTCSRSCRSSSAWSSLRSGESEPTNALAISSRTAHSSVSFVSATSVTPTSSGPSTGVQIQGANKKAPALPIWRGLGQRPLGSTGALASWPVALTHCFDPLQQRATGSRAVGTPSNEHSVRRRCRT